MDPPSVTPATTGTTRTNAVVALARSGRNGIITAVQMPMPANATAVPSAMRRT